MTMSMPEMSCFNTDRLLASVVILHEASCHGEMIPGIPAHLAEALGASSVSMVLARVSDTGNETARTAYTSGLGATPAGSADNDWTTELLGERSAMRASGQAQLPVTRFATDGRAHALFDLGERHIVAFEIQTPAAVYAITDNGRAWLVSLLGHIARNLAAQIDGPSPSVREIAPLNELTDGEWRVLLAIDCEASEKEIAASLSLSTHTLHSHIKNVYRMLRVRSRLGAISLLHCAMRQALLQQLKHPGNSGDSGSANSSESPAENASATPWDPLRSKIAVLPSVKQAFQQTRRPTVRGPRNLVDTR